MDAKDLTKEYSNGEVTIVWKNALCQHAAASRRRRDGSAARETRAPPDPTAWYRLRIPGLSLPLRAGDTLIWSDASRSAIPSAS